jgi:hypothetical protein
MKIKLTKSGISFGSLVKLFSVGHFIGMGILYILIFVPLGYLKWGQTMPAFFWLMLPFITGVQSLFIAAVVAAGVKLYGKMGKFETSSCERPLQQVNEGDGE